MLTIHLTFVKDLGLGITELIPESYEGVTQVTMFPDASRPRLAFYVVNRDFCGWKTYYFNELRTLDIKPYTW